MIKRHHREIATFRPMPIWPYPVTENRRGRYTFRASWSDTLGLLWNEVRLAAGVRVTSGAPERGSPSFASRLTRGWKSASTRRWAAGVNGSCTRLLEGANIVIGDSCERWEHNVRSVALGLEALRAVDRYGITRQGEQYAGFKALPRPHQDLVDRGRAIIAEHGGDARRALAATHPDHGGAEEDFKAVSAAREAA